MPHDENRTTEYKYTVEGQLSELIVRNAVTGDQVTRWHYGTTLAEAIRGARLTNRFKNSKECTDLLVEIFGTWDEFNQWEETHEDLPQATLEWKAAYVEQKARCEIKRNKVVADLLWPEAEGLNCPCIKGRGKDCDPETPNPFDCNGPIG